MADVPGGNGWKWKRTRQHASAQGGARGGGGAAESERRRRPRPVTHELLGEALWHASEWPPGAQRRAAHGDDAFAAPARASAARLLRRHQLHAGRRSHRAERRGLEPELVACVAVEPAVSPRARAGRVARLWARPRPPPPPEGRTFVRRELRANHVRGLHGRASLGDGGGGGCTSGYLCGRCAASRVTSEDVAPLRHRRVTEFGCRGDDRLLA